VIARAWAPAAVLALAWCVGRTTSAHDMWWALHVAGGAALAFFFLRGRRYAIAFALACGGALGWEFGEFVIGQVFGSALQEGRLDTISDLLLGASGAAAYLAFAALPRSEREAGDQPAR
jgi:hypothetical protein